jgi:hypothetical protein
MIVRIIYLQYLIYLDKSDENLFQLLTLFVSINLQKLC